MKRLVYAPYVHAFVKTDDGVVDISPYLIRGSVSRKLNQVSGVQLTLRNPVIGGTNRMLFTEYTSAIDSEPHPMFHPMDPIVVIMQRLQAHPVQVFTGYIDTAPYFQLYPGPCSITASCTLKRLLYTQWDAALPAVQEFLGQFGWLSNGSGIWNPNAEAERVIGVKGGLKGQFNDGSIGSLLFAVMNIIGNWDHTTIWIEALPTAIKPLVLALYKNIAKTVQKGDVQFESLIQQILGSTSQGSGSPTTAGTAGGSGQTIASIGTIPDSSQFQPQQLLFSVNLASLTGLDAAVIAAWCLQEENGSYASARATAGNNNWLNVGYTGGSVTNPFQIDPVQAAVLTANWIKGVAQAGFGQVDPGITAILSAAGQSPQAQIAAIQTSPWATSHEPNLPGLYAGLTSAFDGALDAAAQNIGSGTSNMPRSGNASTAPTALTGIGGAQLGGNSQSGTTVAGTSPGGKTGSAGATGQLDRFQVMVQAASTIDGKNFPYNYGGGHGSPGIPTQTDGSSPGFDCSSGVSAVLFAAGLTTAVFATSDEVSTLGSNVASGVDGTANACNIFICDPSLPSTIQSYAHTFMQLGGRYWGTFAPGAASVDGPHWLSGTISTTGFAAYHVPQQLLGVSTANALPAAAGGPGGSASVPAGGAGTSGDSGSGTSSMAAAFSTMMNLPSVFTADEAIIFTGKRSFIADQPLFPFVEQLCRASLRSFQSMPNGNFFAFFPDYFGFFGRKYYWEVRDIEIIDARIDLSDDALITHMAVAGDVTTYSGEVTFWDLVLTAGIFDIFDAISTGYVGVPLPPFTGGFDPTVGREQALAFLQKYGARPYVEEVPAIRSPFFELFLAFQNFMLAWSKQFQTTIELTFMPELFPGGLIALPDHHIQVYVEEVEHTFDYEQGFTTMVSISAPSVIKGDAKSRSNLSLGLARPAALASIAVDGAVAALDLSKAVAAVGTASTSGIQKVKRR